MRGAPLIATVGMFSLLVELHHNFHINKFVNDCVDQKDVIIEFKNHIFQMCDYLLSARPTAINLANIIEDLKQFINKQINFDYNQTTSEYIYQLNHRFFLFLKKLN